MRAPITRPSNVAGMLLAGAYVYMDFPGAEPQAVDVTYVDGCPVCRFRDAEPGDEGLELDPRDMAGRFLRV
jgi:hypothetical protein